MNHAKPDYTLSVLFKNTSAKGRVGVGWSQPDGSISIALNPCVQLTYNENIVIRLFKNTEDYQSPKATKAQKKYLSRKAKGDALSADEAECPF